MGTNKKRILIIILSLIILTTIIIAVLLVLKNLNKEETVELPEEDSVAKLETLENDFRNKLYNIDYTEDNNNMVETVFEHDETKENKYSIRVNIPKINIETDLIKSINDNIINSYGAKLLDIRNNSQEYTLYNLDYIAHVNNDILSLIIKTTLKEGTNPQRLIIQTYNYDIVNDKIVTLDEMLKLKNIDEVSLQNKIIDTVREKNTNTSALAEQGYNIYVRDIRSDEYLIENINVFLLGEDGHLYILFPYGNKNFTETMDIIIE